MIIVCASHRGLAFETWVVPHRHMVAHTMRHIGLGACWWMLSGYHHSAFRADIRHHVCVSPHVAAHVCVAVCDAWHEWCLDRRAIAGTVHFGVPHMHGHDGWGLVIQPWACRNSQTDGHNHWSIPVPWGADWRPVAMGTMCGFPRMAHTPTRPHPSTHPV